jgi:hypothetical protein
MQCGVNNIHVHSSVLRQNYPHITKILILMKINNNILLIKIEVLSANRFKDLQDLKDLQ